MTTATKSKNRMASKNGGLSKTIAPIKETKLKEAILALKTAFSENDRNKMQTAINDVEILTS